MSNKLYCKKGFFRFRKDNGKEFIVDKRKMEAICIDPNYLSYFARSIIDSLPMEELDVDDYCYRRFIVHNLKTDEYIKIPVIEKTIEEIGKGRCVHVQFENLTYNSKRVNTSYACEINTTAHSADKRTWFCSRTVSENGFVRYRYLNE